jgi:uncharacterized SAM-binding protein YcdF (DUF218 family)
MAPARSRTRRWAWRVLLAVVAFVVALAVPAARRAGTLLVESHPLPLPGPDAIVSLASHEWERLPAAAAQAARYPRAVVVLTQPDPVTVFNCHDCANRVRRLTLAGVSADRVLIVPLVEGGTYGEALAVRLLAETRRLQRILVVTSPYHTRRAFATFRAALAPVGVQVGIEPSTAFSAATPQRWWSAPYDRAYVRYEWAGILYYTLRHRIG